MVSAQYFNAIPMTQITVLGAAITTAYTLIGTFTSWAHLMIIVSNVNALLTLSFDGIHDHVTVVPGNTTPCVIPLEFKSNHMSLPLPSVYVKSAGAPSTGTLAISGFTSLTN
jgi:hypothetical protein